MVVCVGKTSVSIGGARDVEPATATSDPICFPVQVANRDTNNHEMGVASFKKCPIDHIFSVGSQKLGGFLFEFAPVLLFSGAFRSPSMDRTGIIGKQMIGSPWSNLGFADESAK